MSSSVVYLPQSELQAARAHLHDNQERLAYERGATNDMDRIRFFEATVLSALSWVWDAQERAGLNISFRHIVPHGWGTYSVVEFQRGDG